MSIGYVPADIEFTDILEHIDETIIIADLSHTITWMNDAAVKILGPLYPLFGIAENEGLIGKHMDFFHSHPAHQKQIMHELNHTHRTVITIKNTYVAETVIAPIYNKQQVKQGYILMLLDVTEKAQQEKEKEQIIALLSTPILKIWDSVLAIPIIGNLTNERADRLLETILKKCVEERAEYFLLDLSSLSKIDESSGYHINKIGQSLRLIGTECFVVGVSPSLASSISQSNVHWKTFSHVQQAIQEIMTRRGISFSYTS